MSRYIFALSRYDGNVKKALTYARRRKIWKDTPQVVTALEAASGLVFNGHLARKFEKALAPKAKPKKK